MGIVYISSMDIFVDNSRLNGQFCYYIIGESLLIIMIGYIIILSPFLVVTSMFMSTVLFSIWVNSVMVSFDL